MFKSYRAKFNKTIPFVFPLVVAGAFGTQFRLASQGNELRQTKNQVVQLQSQNSKDSVLLTGLRLTESRAEGQDVHAWITAAVSTGLIKASVIPAFEEQDYFNDTFSALSSQERKDFILQVYDKINRSQSSAIIAVPAHYYASKPV